MAVVALLLFFLAGDFDARLREGLAALNRNDLAAARRSFESANTLEPRNPRAWVGLAQTYARLNDSRKASEAAEKAAALAGSDPVALYGLGMFHLQNGNPGQAVDWARRLIAVEERVEGRTLLGKALESAGRYDEAIAEWRSAVRGNRFEESLHFELAATLLRRQQFALAIETLEDSRKTFARSPQLELALGVAYYGQRRFTEALDAFLRTMSIAPAIEQPYVFLAKMIDQAAARLDEIETRFHAFAAANPRNHLGPYLEAKVVMARSGDLALAEKLLRQALAIEPGHTESHGELAGLLEKRRQWGEALSEYRTAVRQNPSDPAPHYRMARIFERIGQPDRAAAERAIHAKLSAAESALIDQRLTAVTVK